MEKQAPEARPTISATKKCLTIFSVSVLAAFTVSIANQESAKPITEYIARNLGGAIACFLFAMIFASFIKGMKGAAAGSILAIGFAFLSWYGNYENTEIERTTLNNLNNSLTEINQSAKRNIEERGNANLDLSATRGMLDQLEQDSRKLSKKDQDKVDALQIVSRELLSTGELTRSLSEEIESTEFQDLSKLESKESIDRRIKKIEELESTIRKSISQFENLDIRLKSELAKKGFPPLEAQKITESFLNSAKLELTIPLAEVNLRYSQILSEKFSLLYTEFDHWNFSNGKLSFESTPVLETWNKLSREYFSTLEQRESLQRKIFKN